MTARSRAPAPRSAPNRGARSTRRRGPPPAPAADRKRLPAGGRQFRWSFVMARASWNVARPRSILRPAVRSSLCARAPARAPLRSPYSGSLPRASFAPASGRAATDAPATRARAPPIGEASRPTARASWAAEVEHLGSLWLFWGAPAVDLGSGTYPVWGWSCPASREPADRRARGPLPRSGPAARSGWRAPGFRPGSGFAAAYEAAFGSRDRRALRHPSLSRPVRRPSSHP